MTQINNWWKRLGLRDIYLILLALSTLPVLVSWKWLLLKRWLPKQSNDPACLRTFYAIFKHRIPKQPNQTLREYYQLILDSGVVASEQIDALIDYIYQIKYHDHPRDRQLEKRFSAALKCYHKGSNGPTPADRIGIKHAPLEEKVE